MTKFCKKLIVSSSFIPASAVNSQLLDKLHNHLDSVFFATSQYMKHVVIAILFTLNENKRKIALLKIPGSFELKVANSKHATRESC